METEAPKNSALNQNPSDFPPSAGISGLQAELTGEKKETHLNPNSSFSTTLGKNKLSLLNTFETMYQKLGGSTNIKNPFLDIDPDEDISVLWKKLGNNRMLGILHSFVLLRPLIKDAIEKEESKVLEQQENKINNEAKLLSDMAMKIDYLNTVVDGVVTRNAKNVLL
jgi:hypothetical protein